jgi:hypothetical protein
MSLQIYLACEVILNLLLLYYNKGGNMKTAFMVLPFVILLFIGCDNEDKSEPGPVPAENYMVFSDVGLAADGADIWTWSGQDFGGPPGTFEANYSDTTSPEGDESFYTRSGADWAEGYNYAGWGVFLINPSDHSVNLSTHTKLKFWVKSTSDLKIEIQSGNRNGSKATTYLSANQWDGINNWQEISIPTATFNSVNLENVFCPFMVTVESGGRSFFIDNVRWVKE